MSERNSLFAEHIPLMRPWLGEEEVEAIREVVLSGWVSLGPKVQEFEQQVAARIGAKQAVATTSATTALHLSLQVMGLERGDEVILPALTCMANANAVIIAGGKCVFADVDLKTYNLDVNDVRKRITPKTKAIMLVDQIGLPADVDSFRILAEQHKLLLVDDAATAFGAKYKTKYLGSQGVTTCYSFHPRKMITTGEGGMLVTDNEEWAERARVLRSTGASVSDLKRHEARGAIFQEYFESGYNYRMTDMQAAMGIVQLRKLDAMLEQRTVQANRYTDWIRKELMGYIEPPYIPEYASPAFSSYCIANTGNTSLSCDEIVRKMAEANISCRRGIQALYKEPYFASEMSALRLPNTEWIAQHTLFLPIFPGLSEQEQCKVFETLKKIVLSK